MPYLTGDGIGIDIPEHAIERAMERFGMSERDVLAYWRGIISSGHGELSGIPVRDIGHILDGERHWVVTRYSESGIRVMTVIPDGNRRERR